MILDYLKLSKNTIYINNPCFNYINKILRNENITNENNTFYLKSNNNPYLHNSNNVIDNLLSVNKKTKKKTWNIEINNNYTFNF